MDRTLTVTISWKTRLHNGHSLVTFDHSKMQPKQNTWEQQGREAFRRIVWRQIASRHLEQGTIRQSALSSVDEMGKLRLPLEDGTTVWTQLKSIPALRPKRVVWKWWVAEKTKKIVKWALFPPIERSCKIGMQRFVHFDSNKKGAIWTVLSSVTWTCTIPCVMEYHL